MNTRKYITAITCAALLALPTAALADSTDVSLMVGDATISADEATGQPYINDAGRTMIPLRIVSESMGYATDWQPDGSIHITNADGTVDVTLQVGSANYTANGQAGTFETLPILKNDRTYLPARDFTELYGQIYWDNDSRTVWIYNSDAPTYCVLGNSLLRATADGITSVAMPEGYDVSIFGKADVIMQQRVINGVGYIAINYNNNHSQQCPLFRDDGDYMTKIATINGTSSFYVDGNPSTTPLVPAPALGATSSSQTSSVSPPSAATPRPTPWISPSTPAPLIWWTVSSSPLTATACSM